MPLWCCAVQRECQQQANVPGLLPSMLDITPATLKPKAEWCVSSRRGQMPQGLPQRCLLHISPNHSQTEPHALTSRAPTIFKFPTTFK
jgi:hypothetical protein